MLIGRTSEDKTLSSTARLPTVSHSVSVLSIIEGNWSQRRLMEWEMGDKGWIYSLFRLLIMDSGIVTTIHLPYQEPQAQSEGPCVLWQLRAHRQVRLCSQFVRAFPPSTPSCPLPVITEIPCSLFVLSKAAVLPFPKETSNR